MGSDFFENRECEYYPCHAKLKKINCLFCFCPLYHLNDCGGNYVILNTGTKDCSRCVLPHAEGGYAYVIQKLS